jgi:hypothetical protein
MGPSLAAETAMSDDARKLKEDLSTRAAVAVLFRRGHARKEIADILGLTLPTVWYHARELGLDAEEKFGRRYDWDQVQRYYDEGHTVAECMAHFGFAKESWNSARRRGDVRARPRSPSPQELLVAGRVTNRGTIKRCLIRAGLKDGRCEECGLSQWRGRHLSMALHHVNGDNRDNRLENLLLLCPNCHSQTDNFAGRGVRRLRAA